MKAFTILFLLLLTFSCGKRSTSTGQESDSITDVDSDTDPSIPTGTNITDSDTRVTVTPDDVGPFNILFILADDLGVMDVGAYNPDTFYDTPGLDKLADEGMRFSNGYAASPVCSPTRFSIMTGRYPSRANATDWFGGNQPKNFNGADMNHSMETAEVTLAEVLKENGYNTAFVGKWHLGSDEETQWPEHQGFDVNIGGIDAGHPPGGYFSPYENPRLIDGPDEEHLPERLTNEAISLLDQYKDEPFYIQLSYYSVHVPLEGKEDLVQKYEDRAAHLPPGNSFAVEEQVWPADATTQDRVVRIKQEHPIYAAMVESMDHNIGRLLDHLETTGLSENTAVIFMSDNGGASTGDGSPTSKWSANATSNLPYRCGKGWVYEGGIREPFIIKVPGVTPGGSVSATPVISNDFFPTILSLTKTPMRPELHLDGVDLWPLLAQSGGIDREVLFWHYPHYSNQGGFPGGAIRMGKYKLVERYEDGRVHLYDLDADPGERNDLATTMSDQVNDMRQKLHAWYIDVAAQFLRPLDGGPEPWSP